MKRIMVVYGTRPEAVKMAPVIRALQQDPDVTPEVVLTGQHRSMLDQVNGLFGILSDHDLDIIQPRQTLDEVTVRALAGLAPLLRADHPDAVLVQGDTTTTFTAALAAFYERVPVVHLEAGLRTGDIRSPFPEEMNRRLTSRLTALHLAPTGTSRANLEQEGVDPGRIVVTGNTVIDALLAVVNRRLPYEEPLLRAVDADDRRVLLVTAHRRESWGEPMRDVGRAVASLAQRNPDLLVVLPAHRNPVVRETLLPALEGLPNVLVVDPLGYGDFARLMARAHLVLTDSGGVQEEAPSLGKPVLVLRDNTERPEAVRAGTVRLVGTDPGLITSATERLLTDPVAYTSMARAVNPYGDGDAARRSVQAVRNLFGLGSAPDEFIPGPRVAASEGPIAPAVQRSTDRARN